MRAIELLNNLRRYNAIVESRSEELEVIFGKATSITAPLSDEPTTSKASDKIGNLVATYVDKETELQLRWYISEIRKIKATIDKLDYPKEIQVLYQIYDKNMYFDDIAMYHNKSISWVRQTRIKGIKHLQEVLDEM